MPCIEEMHLNILQIPLEGMGTLWTKKRIIFAPNNQGWWLVGAEVLMPLGILLQICPVVVEQFQLSRRIFWTIQEGLIEIPVVGVDILAIAHPCRVKENRCIPLEEIAHRALRWLLSDRSIDYGRLAMQELSLLHRHCHSAQSTLESIRDGGWQAETQRVRHNPAHTS